MTIEEKIYKIIDIGKENKWILTAPWVCLVKNDVHINLLIRDKSTGKIINILSGGMNGYMNFSEVLTELIQELEGRKSIVKDGRKYWVDEL